MSNTQVIARDRLSCASELPIVVQTQCHSPPTTYSSTLDIPRSNGIWTALRPDRLPWIKWLRFTLPIQSNPPMARLKKG